MTSFFRKHNLIIALIATFIVSFIGAPTTYAVTAPIFPSCLNPQGDLKDMYKTGTHGVPGDTATYTGTDAVYQLTDDTLTQCLCTDHGVGIQTNWWRFKDLSQSEIEQLTLQGWVYVPDGSAWGLAADPYVAKNITYSCVGGQEDGSNNNDSESNSTSTSSKSNAQGGGDISSGSSTRGQLLALASTGNATILYLLFTVGISLLLCGIYIRSLNPNEHN